MFKKIKAFFSEILSETAVPKEKVASMNISELKKQAQLIHPVGFYLLAMKLFKQGEKDEAIFWFYVGSIRYRHFLSSIEENPFEPENELFGKVQFEIGGTVLDYAGGNPIFWAEQIEKANKWDTEHLNFFYSKKNNPEVLTEIKLSMQQLQHKLLDEKEDIIKQRIENGAEVRL
ncbi:MAG: hypothetical protein U9N57_12110 [Pseudomonadota bacterium]|nr:hypothetical protein [Pseudomonadota bacterium]